MQFTTEGKINIALALVAIAGAGTIVIAPDLTVIALIAIAVTGGILLSAHHFSGRRAMWMIPWILIIGGPIVGAGWLYFARETKLPGFVTFGVMRLYDTPEFRRRYVYEFVTSDGARASFYLSASSVFTFALTDVRGEPYPLEVKIGTNGIPIDKVVALLCEAGLENNSTKIRIIVNEKEVASRNIGFKLNLGKMDWRPGSLGSSLGGKQGGVFLLSEFGIYGSTMTSSEIHALTENVRKFYKEPFD
jgi:hypothetical protein